MPIVDVPEDYEENHRWYRAAGGCICDICGKKYRDHPVASNPKDWEGRPFMYLLCNGDLAKL